MHADVPAVWPDLTPSPLPAHASFAARAEVEPHRHEAAELAALGPRAVPARRRAFRLGRAAARAALRPLVGDAGPILVRPGRDPAWPPGVVGSISHTTDLGVALVAHASHSAGVGIDVEQRRDAPELAEQVPRPEERAWIERSPPERRADLVLALFSAKESIFKAFYPRVGVLFGFEAASLTPAPGGYSARLVVAGLDPAYPPSRTFDVGARWHGDVVMTWVLLPAAP